MDATRYLVVKVNNDVIAQSDVLESDAAFQRAHDRYISALRALDFEHAPDHEDESVESAWFGNLGDVAVIYTEHR